MAKRGRPRGLNINRQAVEDLLRRLPASKGELCEAAEISPGHFADAMVRGKGLSPAAVRAMADFLQVHPATIAPGMTPNWVFVRPQDVAEAVAS